MLPFRLAERPGGIRLLLIGAHCDDIEIGCGATILRLKEEYKIEEVKWVVFTSNTLRADEAKNCASIFLNNVKNQEVRIYSMKDGHLPFAGSEVKSKFEELKAFEPDMVFTHARHDRHQDHRLLAEMTWNTFRDHLIFEYEIPKYEGDLGHPNLFVAIPPELAQKKVDAIVEGYPSQSGKQWFDRETFQSLMRIRGLECASVTRYAEAFYVNKAVV